MAGCACRHTCFAYSKPALWARQHQSLHLAHHPCEPNSNEGMLQVASSTAFCMAVDSSSLADSLLFWLVLVFSLILIVLRSARGVVDVVVCVLRAVPSVTC